jgi:hypothetical protein
LVLRVVRAQLALKASGASWGLLGLLVPRACRVRREKLVIAGCPELRACPAPPERAVRLGLRDPRVSEETWDPMDLQVLRGSRVPREWLAQQAREESREQLGLRASRAWLGQQAPREIWAQPDLRDPRVSRV